MDTNLYISNVLPNHQHHDMHSIVLLHFHDVETANLFPLNVCQHWIQSND
jgi:hypothetical protein